MRQQEQQQTKINKNELINFIDSNHNNILYFISKMPCNKAIYGIVLASCGVVKVRYMVGANEILEHIYTSESHVNSHFIFFGVRKTSSSSSSFG